MDAELVRYITEKCRKNRISPQELLKIKVTPVGVKGGVPWDKLMPKDEMQLQSHVAPDRKKCSCRFGMLSCMWATAHAWSV